MCITFSTSLNVVTDAGYFAKKRSRFLPLLQFVRFTYFIHSENNIFIKLKILLTSTIKIIH